MRSSNILEGLSNPIAGPDSERAADKRKEDAAKREDVATPQYRDVASDGRSDEEADPAQFLCIHKKWNAVYDSGTAAARCLSPQGNPMRRDAFNPSCSNTADLTDRISDGKDRGAGTEGK